MDFKLFSKKILLLLVLALFISCDDDDEEEPATTLSFSTYVFPVSLNGLIITPHIIFTLYDANGITYAENQTAANLKQFQAVDESGTLHKAVKTLSPSTGTGHVNVDEGRYLACIMLQETGRFSYTYVDVKKGEDTSIQKIFLLLIPIDEFEQWEIQSLIN